MRRYEKANESKAIPSLFSPLLLSIVTSPNPVDCSIARGNFSEREVSSFHRPSVPTPTIVDPQHRLQNELRGSERTQFQSPFDPKMQPRFVLLALPFCLLSFSSGEFPCPEADEILPCVCSYEVATNEVLVDCSAANTSAQIFTAFNDGFWPFTKLTEFRLDGFRQVTELPEGVFGDISFQRIYVETTDLVSVHPSALLSSEDDLERLRIRYSHLGGFPWETLAELAGLAYLDLVFNDLTAMSSFQGPSLEELHVSNNMIATLTAGSGMNEPSGCFCTSTLLCGFVDDNPISVIPYGFFEGMDNLVEFQCRSCNLGPTVSNGSLAFRSRSLESVYLVDNIISTIEPDGISGMHLLRIHFVLRGTT
ncbi:unnamed protein product [Darwinula stevensoni]|uniref:Uncharacterized protein n=1 Tax=Darwinula stevensoni TaxID=69355 RepID=A0A7R9AEP1_9CRUS|nr:unnamed protein product [Darwinula stevensoni]CAG0902096.1 unnamed protein product [Darwinula stevensoni]